MRLTLTWQLWNHADGVQAGFLFDLFRAVQAGVQEMQAKYQSTGGHETEDENDDERALLVRV